MKVIIAGSRGIQPYLGDELVRIAVRIAGLRRWKFDEVVCGEAQGIDRCGRRWAELHGVPVKSFPPDWNKHGKAGGFIRNGEMAEYADALIAITYGTNGTQDMIDKARAKKLQVIVLQIPPENSK